MKQNVDISIVLELDNTCLHHSELNEKISLQLLSLNKQIAQSKYQFEILICFSNKTINEALLKNINNLAENKFSLSQLKLLDFNDASYYQLKNYGADSSQGNIIIFLDSDVTCNTSWLENILRPFQENEHIQVVAGRTELEALSTIQQSQTLVTFFDNYKKIESMSITENFFANNVAFKKELFQKYKFPINHKTTRTSCTQLAINLSRDGIDIYKQHHAIVHHRSAHNLSELLFRSFIEGRDLTFNKLEKHKSLFKKASIPIKIFKNKFRLVTDRVGLLKTHSHTSTISLASLLIAYLYIFIMCISASFTLVLPKFMHSRFLKI